MNMDLRHRARSLFPTYLPSARHNRRAWLRSALILRAKGLWLIEGAPARWHATATTAPTPRMQTR